MIWRQPGFRSTVKELLFLHCSDYPCQVVWVKTTALRYGAARTSRGQRGEVIPLSWYCHQNSSVGKCWSEEGVWIALVRHPGKSLRGAVLERDNACLGVRGSLVVQAFLCSRKLTFYILVNKQKFHLRCLAPLIIAPSSYLRPKDFIKPLNKSKSSHSSQAWSHQRPLAWWLFKIISAVKTCMAWTLQWRIDSHFQPQLADL